RRAVDLFHLLHDRVERLFGAGRVRLAILAVVEEDETARRDGVRDLGRLLLGAGEDLVELALQIALAMLAPEDRVGVGEAAERERMARVVVLNDLLEETRGVLVAPVGVLIERVDRVGRQSIDRFDPRLLMEAIADE